MRRALILRGGVMEGAHLAGVMKVLYEKLGPDYFDTIYSNSVGIFEQVFYASRQVETMENTWRNYVHGSQLISFLNPIRGKPILDLDYLIDLFKSSASYLDVSAMKNSRSDLFCLLTNHKTRSLMQIDIKKEDVFEIMKATCALPIFYSGKFYFNGERVIDGALCRQSDLDEFIASVCGKFEEVWIATNRNRRNRIKPHRNLYFLRPSCMPIIYPIDTNRHRIIATIEQGKQDAIKFLEDYEHSKYGLASAMTKFN